MKHLKYSILLVVLVVLGNACSEDFIDKQPPLQLANEKVLSTYTGLVQATNAAYAPLYDERWYGREFIVIGDLKGGNAKSSPLNTGRYQMEYNWGNNPSNTTALWSMAYMTISRANNILEYVDGIEEPGVTEEQLGQIKGESLFLRALSYFDLVRMYAQPYSQAPSSMGVPIVLKTEIVYPPRNTVAEVYDQIVADLLAAEEVISVPGRGTDPVAYASVDAVRALLAKVYLYMENWASAAEYATKVIDSGNYTLYTADEYASVWGTDAASEVIFEVFGDGTQSQWPGYDEIGYIFDPEGYGDVCASNQLLDLFPANDVRGQLYESFEDYTEYYWPLKYPGKDKPNVNNIPLLRLSEMYLIRAEAALNGASGDALADYNAVLTQRGYGPDLTVSLKKVYLERRRELAFEGNQLWDLSRTGRGLNRDEAETTVTGDVDIPFPDYRWAMPIPLYEMEANENMEQNPGYGN